MTEKQSPSAVLEILQQRWPACFSIIETRRKPLKLKIHVEILAVMGSLVTEEELKAALAAYCSSPFYRKALKEKALRVDLDGKPIGIVSKEESEHAASQAMWARHEETLNAVRERSGNTRRQRPDDGETN